MSLNNILQTKFRLMTALSHCYVRRYKEDILTVQQ